MRVVAKKGDKVFLVSLNDDMEQVNKDPRAQGRVLDLEQKRFGPPRNIHSIYNGYWQAAETTPEELQAMIEQVAPVVTA